MNTGVWLPGMSVGVAELDKGHKAFFALLARIIEALDRQSFENAEQLCQELIALGTEHAEAETAFLQRNGYQSLSGIIEVQKALAERCRRLMALVTERSPNARDVADKTVGDMIEYLLRGDINFKSFVEEMRDLGRLK